MHSPDTEEKMEYNKTVHQESLSYDSVRRVLVYIILTVIVGGWAVNFVVLQADTNTLEKHTVNILSIFVIPMELVRLTEMCLNETHLKIHTSKHMSGVFPTQYGLKQGDA